MGEYKLLTIDDLCKRWHKSEKTIRRYIADGKIKPCKNLTNMFRPEEIARYEGGEPSTFSTALGIYEFNHSKSSKRRLTYGLLSVFSLISMILVSNLI